MAQIELVMIGGGNMGEAMLRGVLGANLLSREQVVVAEPLEPRRQVLSKELKIAAVAAIADAPPSPRYVLAVKPQQMEAAASALAGCLADRGAMVLSVAAGISTAYLAEKLGAGARLVRAMPNTPMLVGCGCTGLCAGPGATAEDMAFAQKLFASGGKALVVDDESAIDVVTAVSGSGPAYFFYLIEAMVAAGVAEGLDADTATALAGQTCAGAAALLAASAEEPAALRAKVTSPGGTTQAAITSMDAAGVQAALVAGVRAAAARSRELGK